MKAGPKAAADVSPLTEDRHPICSVLDAMTEFLRSPAAT
jgi:hypothetical protein